MYNKNHLSIVLKKKLYTFIKEDEDSVANPPFYDPTTGEFGDPAFGAEIDNAVSPRPHGEQLDQIDQYCRNVLGISLDQMHPDMRTLIIRMLTSGRIPTNEEFLNMFPDTNVDELENLAAFQIMFFLALSEGGVHSAALGRSPYWPSIVNNIKLIAYSGWRGANGLIHALFLANLLNNADFLIDLLSGLYETIGNPNSQEGTEASRWFIEYFENYIQQWLNDRGITMSRDDIRDFNREINGRDKSWIIRWFMQPENPLVIYNDATGRYYVYARGADGQWVMQYSTNHPEYLHGMPAINSHNLPNWHPGQVFINGSIDINIHSFEKTPYAAPTQPINISVPPTIAGGMGGIGNIMIDPSRYGMGTDNPNLGIA